MSILTSLEMETDSSRHVSIHHISVLSILPVELLAQIFMQYILLHRRDVVSQRECTEKLVFALKSSPYTLMHVCTLWRDIVKREPCLWTVISIVVPQYLPPIPEMIHQAAAQFVIRLEKRVALARELSLSLILTDQGRSQKTHIFYLHVIALFPRCHSICILTAAPASEDSYTEASASWSSVAGFLQPSYPQLLELQIELHSVHSVGIPVGLKQCAAKLVARAPNLLSLQFAHTILNDMRGASSTLEDLVVPDVELRIDVLVRMLKHYPRLRKLTLGPIMTGYYFIPFVHDGLTHLALDNDASRWLMDDDVLNGLTLPALVDFRIAQGLRSNTSWPTQPTFDFLSRSKCKLVAYHVSLQQSSRNAGAFFDAVRWQALLRMQPSLIHLHVKSHRPYGVTAMASNEDLRILTDRVCPALLDLSLSISHSQLPIMGEVLEFRCAEGERGVAKLEACTLDLLGSVPAVQASNLGAYFAARQFPVSLISFGRRLNASLMTA